MVKLRSHVGQKDRSTLVSTTQNSHINFQEHRYLQKFDYLLAVKTSSRSIIERCTTFLRAINCINNFAIAEYLTVTTRALLQFIDEKSLK